jgi:exopolyphosphatase / guanosine-5'-triphosphate,3'-diphosphate pyrophosphatase
VRLAAIDVGTNTVRLLVADASEGKLERVDHARVVTRLGEGVDANRRLQPKPVVRTLQAIGLFAERARDVGAEQIRIAGTSVLRDAADRDAFAREVLERTGVSFEVLSGDQEGRIAYLGATSELPDGNYVVCDIGGGSTELATSRSATSMDIGSVRLRERCLLTDPPEPHEIAHARSVVETVLEHVDVPERHALVGVAATVTTLAALALGLESYEADKVHLTRTSRADVERWSNKLLEMSAEQIAALGPVERGRADLIGGGSLILALVMEGYGFEEVLVSERDILDGLVLDLIG